MKRFLALMLTLVLLLTVAAPAMAAGGEDAVCPCAVCANGNHSLTVAHVSYSDWGYVNNTTHSYKATTHYICSRCNYSYADDPVAKTGSHSASGLHTMATCNGTTQTRYYDCDDCGYEFAKSVRCPGATHTGKCMWL